VTHAVQSQSIAAALRESPHIPAGLQSVHSLCAGEAEEALVAI
jgi:hypothetical protein